MNVQLKIVMLAGSCTRNDANEHAIVYRNLVSGLCGRGHEVLVLSPSDRPRTKKTDPLPAGSCRASSYSCLSELTGRFGAELREADLVLTGSDIPECEPVLQAVVAAAHGITAFYDLDPSATLAGLSMREEPAVPPETLLRADLYLSLAGGRVFNTVRERLGLREARTLYRSVDPRMFTDDRDEAEPRFDLGIAGGPHFPCSAEAGSLFSKTVRRWDGGRFSLWGGPRPSQDEPSPGVVASATPAERTASFYRAHRFVLNREQPPPGAHDPGPLLLEAAACATPVIMPYWEGLELFFELGKEVLTASSAEHVLHYLRKTRAEERTAVATRARARVVSAHSSVRRALQLEQYTLEMFSTRKRVFAAV